MLAPNIYGLNFVSLVILFWTGKITFALDCFACKNVTDLLHCHETVATCSSNQRCYHTVHNIESIQVHSKGCIDTTQCKLQDTLPTLIGKRSTATKQTTTCHECCSVNFCNANSCNYDHSCADDVNTDCARIHSLFNVCNDTHHAKLLCRKYCGFCNLVDGGWAAWGSYSSCSATCGDGFETRTRTCDNPAPAHGGLACIGSSSEQQPCNLKPCIVDGQWTVWGGWTTCSTTCGEGMSTRNRNCTNPSPANGGLDCTGNSTEHKPCNLALCPVHGNWSIWTNWTTCSVTCGMGLIRRTRNCDNPRPGLLGDWCNGEAMQYNTCMTRACADGAWSVWSTWSNCSAHCGQGFTTRNRRCDNPAPSVMGKNCIGSNNDVISCNRGKCPGFNARMQGPWNYMPAVGDTVPFTVEDLDIGDGYETSTSTYTVPLTGVYDFTWSLISVDKVKYSTELVVNSDFVDVQLSETQTHDGSYLKHLYTTTTKVLPVQKGDRVFIRVNRISGTAYMGSFSDGYSTFSGWLRH